LTFGRTRPGWVPCALKWQALEVPIRGTLGSLPAISGIRNRFSRSPGQQPLSGEPFLIRQM
jgi:hypothetical protein